MAVFKGSIDWYLLGAVALVTLFGLAGIFSLDRGQLLEGLPFFSRQLMAWGISLGIVGILSRFEYRLFQYVSSGAYLLSVGLMILVLFFGHTIRGTTGWFAFAGFSFQPVEVMKVMLIVHLAHFFSKNRDHFRTWWVIVGSSIITGIPVVLTLLQPDAGSALLMLGTWFVMLLISGVQRKHVIAGGVIMVIATAIAWNFFFAEYQKNRIRTFFDPAHDIQGSGYNVNQSIIAVGSGRILGKGLGFGSQSQLRFLPEARTDFMFAALAEELGLVGILLLISLMAFIQTRLLSIATHAVDDFGVFVVMGYSTLLLVQTLVNVGMNMGILPVTGIVLPFVSYGGTALIAQWLLLGIVLQISRASRRATPVIG